jgi:hypothetical protein
MACDPNTLLEQARPFLLLTEEQRAVSIITALADIAEGGGFLMGDFRITELGDIRETESGDLRVWH